MRTRIFSPGARMRKAYWVTFRVAWSYMVAYYLKRVMGKQWYERRLERIHSKNAILVKNAILDLEGLFIKVGQLLSIMSNALPEAFQEPLESLQDKIPPRPFEEVEARFSQELGKSPSELFSEFEQIPIAAASIGQAHLAKLHSGEVVVVKVQHLDIEEVAKLDLKIINDIIKVFSWFFAIKGLDYMYSQISKMIEEELDYRMEARSMAIISKNLSQNPKVLIPKVYQEYTTDRILVTEFMPGNKVSEVDKIKANGIDTEVLAADLWQVYCEMVFRDGFYHADPHPGNILIQADGKVVLLDFGATASLGKEFRVGIPKLMEAALKNDVDTIISTCYSLGFLADGPDAENLAKRLVGAVQNFIRNEAKIDSLNFKDIEVDPFNNSVFNLINEIGFKGLSGSVQIPKDYVLLNRAITLMIGISFSLAPKYNPLDIVRPYAKEYLFKEQGGVIGLINDFIKKSVLTAISLPGELLKNLQKARRGELELKSPDTIKGASIVAQSIYFTAFLGASCSFFWMYRVYGDSYQLMLSIVLGLFAVWIVRRN